MSNRNNLIVLTKSGYYLRILCFQERFKVNILAVCMHNILFHNVLPEIYWEK